jgi:malate dehydrogenase (oxaloacetate-decarboxylating)(NADP+)
LGRRRENIWVSDLEGVVYQGPHRSDGPLEGAFAQKTDLRSLAEIIPGADVFLGLSAGGVLKPDYLKAMAPEPWCWRWPIHRPRSCRKTHWRPGPTR